LAPRILIVEDEESLTLLLRYNLEAAGYAVESVARGDEAELRIAEEPPDLVLLDWMLPGVSGVELCRRIRAGKNTQRLPIIMLTARGEETDRIVGLELGADDYIVKPFSAREVAARIRAVLRRADDSAAAEAPPPDKRGPLEVRPVLIDRKRRAASMSGNDLDLTRKEFELLELLMREAGTVISRERLIDDRPIQLTRREFELLRYLVQNRNRVLSRDRLLERVRDQERENAGAGRVENLPGDGGLCDHRVGGRLLCHATPVGWAARAVTAPTES